MPFIFASIPILLILILMIGFHWGADRAGGAGYLSALLVAIAFFGATPQLIAYAQMKALLLTVDVLAIIWAAFLFYRVTDEAGAIRVIGDALPHLTDDRCMQAILIGWVFATFLQGFGGFGVPVAVIAPILIGLGFSPLASIIISSIGHAWGVTFGSLGSSFNALLAASNLPASVLAPPSALFLGVAGLLGGMIVVQYAGGWSNLRRLILPILILGVVMGGVQYLVAVSGPWNISTLLAGIAGLAVGFPLAYRHAAHTNDNGDLDLRAVIIALSAYAILIVVTLGVQLIQPLNNLLSGIEIGVQFPELSTALGYVTPAGPGRNLVIFRHTGMVLFYVCILSYLVYKAFGLYQAGAAKRILGGTMRRMMSSSVGIASMVSMAVIMEHAGMTNTLARGLAENFGAVYPLVAPWIGALGAFITGSNTNSNVVFTGLQMTTAGLLGYSVPIILAAQTAGAALMSVVAPTKVVVGTSTTGMSGKEGEIIRKLFIYICLLVLSISLMTMVGVWLAGI